MKRRVFLCGAYDFPRGSASANYVQYLAEAFIDIGYDIILITNVNDKELSNPLNFVNRNRDVVTLVDITSKHNKGRAFRYAEVLFLQGKWMVDALKKHQANNNDLIIVYDAYPSTHNEILKFANKNSIKTGACIVEWFPKEMYSRRIINIDYWKTKLNFKKVFFKYNYLMPISSFIENYFVRNGHSKVLRLPVMCDPFEYKNIKKKEDGKIRIIYSGASRIKEDMDSFFCALSYLNEEQWEKVEFHFCGIKYDNVYEYFSEDMKKRINNSIIFHGWMDYEELINLYQDMNYLILPRKISQMTLANFPSKVPEAMCYGVVPVVSDVGDYTNLYLKDKYDSLIFGESNIEECYAAISRIIEVDMDKYDVLSKNARNTVIEKFYYKVWEKTIADFFA